MLKKIFSHSDSRTKVLWYNNRWYSRHQIQKAVDRKVNSLKKIKEKNLICVLNKNDFTSVINILACLESKCNFCLVSYGFKNIESVYEQLSPSHILDGSKITSRLDTHVFSVTNPSIVFLTSSISPKAVVHDAQKLIKYYLKWTKSHPRKTILTFPLDHMGGINLAFKTWMSGGALIIPNSRSVDGICQAIRITGVDTLPATPTLLRLIMLKYEKRKNIFLSLRTISYGAEMMDQETLNKTLSFFKNVQVFQTYGLTEVGVLNLQSQKKNETYFKFRNLTRVNYKIKKGILYLKKPDFFIGYYDKKIIRTPAWFCTHDIMAQNAKGLKVLGREKDVINVAGMKAFPVEIENVLLKSPIVAHVFVYKEKCAVLGERVVADIILKDGSSKNAVLKIRDFCLGKLEKYKVPQRINILSKIDFSDRFKRRQIS